jgi:putative transcriptional regulator
LLILIKIEAMISAKLNKGQLLIADPYIIGEALFERAVILLTAHDQEGSVGFIINKPLKYSINDLIPGIKYSFKVYNGGPVEQDNLYFIHNVPELIANSVEISNGIYWGGCFNSVKELINERKITKNNIRFFLGYTGWDEDQLESEMEQNSWIVTSNSYKNKIIGVSTLHFWKEKILELGGEYSIWSNAPKNPFLN